MKKQTNAQTITLTILRVLIGWHFLYEGWSKLQNSSWSSIGYLMDSKGWFETFFKYLASIPEFISISNIMVVWGLVLIGISLIAGLFTRIGLISGIALLAMFYLSHPPIINPEYLMPMEGNYLWVDKNLIEIAALTLLLAFKSNKIGIDRFIFRKKN